MKYYLSTFGLHNPFIGIDLPDHAVYPVGTDTGTLIDLDYSLLLFGTGFSIDKAAFEYIQSTSKRLPFLKPMAESAERLRSEGLLDLISVEDLVMENRSAIIEKTQRLSIDYNSWLACVRQQWGVLKKDREDFVRSYGSEEKKDLNSVHFTVANSVHKDLGRLEGDEIVARSKLVNSTKMTFSSTEIETIKKISEPLVAHTVIQDLVRFKTGHLVLDWDDSSPYMKISTERVGSTIRTKDRCFFQVVRCSTYTCLI